MIMILACVLLVGVSDVVGMSLVNMNTAFGIRYTLRFAAWGMYRIFDAHNT